ncbi:hypothetical protein TCSYLVIO_010752, partial [Trypanosoma cruzi]
MCVGVYWRSRKEKHREANQDGKRHGWMAAIHAARRNLNNHARWQHTHIHKNKKHGGRVWLCVCGAAGVCPPWPQNTTKQEGRKCVLRPTGPRRTPTRHGSLSAPFVTAPSARRSSRPLLMRAAGEAHRAVVMSVAVGVRVEQ